MNIDLNRGVTIRRHGPSGVQVYMYKDTPGVFLNAHGTEVSEELAASCGFPVDLLGKERVKRARIAEASARIEAEFNTPGAKHEIVRERNSFQLVALGLGRHKVLDPDGNELHDKPLTLEEGNILLDQMTGDTPVPVVEVADETPSEPPASYGGVAGDKAKALTDKPPMVVQPAEKAKSKK